MTLSPELLRKLGSAPPHESDLQKSVARVLDHSGLTWCHVPNGGKRSPVEAAIMKGHGVKSGVPDVLVFDAFSIDDCRTIEEVQERRDAAMPREDSYRGMAIELKVGKNKCTPAQIEWQDKLRSAGWKVAVCYTLDEVLVVLKECYPQRIK